MNRIVLIFLLSIAFFVREDQLFGQHKPVDGEIVLPKHSLILDSRGNLAGFSDGVSILFTAKTKNNISFIALSSDSVFALRLDQNASIDLAHKVNCPDFTHTYKTDRQKSIPEYWLQPDSLGSFLIFDSLSVSRLKKAENIRPIYAINSKLLYHNGVYQTLATESHGNNDPVYNFLFSQLNAFNPENVRWSPTCESLLSSQQKQAEDKKNKTQSTDTCHCVYCFRASVAENVELRKFVIFNHKSDSLLIVLQAIKPENNLQHIFIQHLQKQSGSSYSVSSAMMAAVLQMPDKSEKLFAAKKTVYTALSDSIAQSLSNSVSEAINYNYTPDLEIDNSLKSRNEKGFSKMLTEGFIPFGFVDFDISKFVGYNDFEGPKFGVGIQTNHRLSKKLGLAAAIGSGIWSRKINFNYGFVYDFKPGAPVQLRLQHYAQYLPSGRSGFDGSSTTLFNDGSYKNMYVNKMDYTKSIESTLGWVYKKKILSTIGFAHQTVRPGYDYSFVADPALPAAAEFKLNELSFGIRYRFQIVNKSKEIYRSSDQTDEVEMRVGAGSFSSPGNGLNYFKIELRARKYFLLGENGILESEARVGINHGDLPYFKMFNIPATWSRFGLFAPGSFATMKPNEFVTDQYLSLSVNFLQRNSFVRKGVVRPRLFVVAQAVTGSINNYESHIGINILAPENGFYEAGFGLHDLLKSGDNGLGIGFFHRIGHYRLEEKKYNYSVKLLLNFGSALQRNPSFF